MLAVVAGVALASPASSAPAKTAHAYDASALVGVWASGGSKGGMGFRCSFAFDARGRFAQSCYPPKAQSGRYRVGRRGKQQVLVLFDRVLFGRKEKPIELEMTVLEAGKRVRLGRDVWKLGMKKPPEALEIYGTWIPRGSKSAYTNAWHFTFADYIKRGAKGTAEISGRLKLVSRKGRKLVFEITKRQTPWRKLVIVLGRDGHSARIDGKRCVRYLRRK
ncbi:MAG: hypothetical protein KC503_45285 [Myxococcales bacterium]|nr:hypothetical protein [Myxococcales bacterium]